MRALLLVLVLAAPAAADGIDDKKPRPPNPLAPSLPALTKEEEARLDQIIDRFMLFDVGALKGDEGQAALRDFKKLGPESIPALIRGLNRAAQLDHSCPVSTIAEKLSRMLLVSNDMELLEFARDNIVIEAGRTRYADLLKELRFRVLMRKNTLARRPPPPPPGSKEPRTMTNAELAEAAGSATGKRLESVLTELEKRKGPEAIAGLATAAGGSSDLAMKELARDLLDRHLLRQPEAVVRQKLKDPSAEVRQSAVRVVAAKMPILAGEVIDLVGDDVAAVRVAARQALVLLSGGEDYGPETDASRSAQAEALKKWRAWWEKKK